MVRKNNNDINNRMMIIVFVVIGIIIVMSLVFGMNNYGYGMMGMMYGVYGFEGIFRILVGVALILFIVWMLRELQGGCCEK
jgi:uncharacterized membrane protein